MAESKETVIPVAIEDEVKTSYLNYAMSVIVARALPDVRDGLKPVHRRILYAMHEMGVRSNQPYKKTGRIVGDVLGKYHPHGDMSIYDALVRLAQDFSLRYPLIQGQGNFGSIDGDPPAAMRYTEARMTKLAEEMLRDINKETVDFGPNYDDSLQEPKVLPAAFPFLLANGASGIAVGMATNMPPHNLREICNAIAHYIDHPEDPVEELMRHVRGPDFPTGGTIYGIRGIREAYTTGKGRIVVRARFTIETTKSGKDMIIITEIPYMVNKAALIMRIAELVKEKNLDGISDLRDESDRDGMRIVIELKKGISPKIILNFLFTHTQLQVNFGVNNLALVNGRPKTLNLKEMIACYVDHRKEVVTRRSKYDLRKAEERAHILEGLKIALENIDEVIAIIKSSGTVEIARTRLIERFHLSEIQAQAILDLRLARLTGLARKEIEEALIGARDGETRDMLVEMRKIALLILFDTLFAVDLLPDLDRLWRPILDLIEYISPGLWILFPNLPVRPKYQRARKVMDEYLYQLIRQRREDLRNGTLPHPDDLLSFLVTGTGMGDDLIRDQLLTLLIAGHDTSTALLAWTFSLLGQHPDAMAKVKTEVDTILGGVRRPPSLDQVNNLVYTDLVIKESLRLYPPIHVGNRKLIEDMTIYGCPIHAGNRLMYSIYLSHRDEACWRDPEAFIPERFDHEEGDPRPPLAYVPFGGGPRNCIGAAFAQVESKVVIARVLQEFDLTLLNGEHIKPHMGATLEPRPGVLMHLQRR